MPLPLELYLDDELRVMHLPDCPGTKMPRKYGYGRIERVRTAEQARELDKAYRACDRCHRKIKERVANRGSERHFRYHKRENTSGGMLG